MTGYNVIMDPLIRPQALAEKLHTEEFVIVDCRCDLVNPQAGRQAYELGHIPGARYADMETDLAARPRSDQGRHPLPAMATFVERLNAWGIGNETTVVAYDAASGAFAARLWWMLRWLGHENAAVLDGGLAAWAALGLPLDHRVPEPPRSRFVPQRVREDWVVSSAEIPDLQASDAILIDARAAPRYRGEEEPIDPVAGHVPGALNYPFSDSLTAEQTFLPVPELRVALQRVIRHRSAERVVAMCGSGVTACHILLAMKAAGLGDGRLYAGSWSEWIRDPRRPIATGSESG